ncbi:NAD-dependent epimerase/dehydratase family protein [Streptomyces zaomyceticus]|uniref:NAD-dependent epimerase/dehydratase family protein n=1 Tax=Streptomyces zaomyceticus TaxID=68286 RepID=UPI003442EA80
MGMDDTRNVLPAGASGVFGRHVAEELRTAGHRVLSLGRGPGHDVVADLMHRDALLRAVDGLKIDTVVHAATALRGAPMKRRDTAATDALRVEGTAHPIEAARAVGARRMIAESMVFGYGYRDFGDRWVTEDDVFGPPGLDRHSQAWSSPKRSAVPSIPSAPSISRSLVRIAPTCGPGGTEALVELPRRRRPPTAADRGRVLSRLELRQSARALALVVEDGRPGGAYDIVDDTPMGFGAHVRATAAAFGTPRP